MTRILVTGATGFIGKALVGRLIRLGHEVVEHSSAIGDVAEQSAWDTLPATSVVYHLAGQIFVPDSWDHPSDFMRVNVQGVSLALDYCRRNDAKLVFVSAYLYGQPTRLPIQESDPVRPNNPYALSKHLAEELCRFAVEYYRQDVAIIRPFNIFGPGQSAKFLVPQILAAVRERLEIKVDDLTPRRDYLYLSDLVEALVLAGSTPEKVGTINVGSGESLSVADIIRAIQRVAGTNLPVRSADRQRRHEIPDVIADISRATELLGWRPRCTFEQGIAKIVEEPRECP